MLMFKKSNKDNGEKIFRYSIRKYHFGAASVAVAALMFFANGVQAQAPAISSATASDVVAGPSGNSDGNPQESDEGERKETVLEQPAEGKPAGELKAQGTKAEEANQEQELDRSKPAPVGQEGPQVGEIKEREESTLTAAKTAAKSTQGTLEALLANLTLDSMKALHAEVEEGLAKAKAVLENPNATQVQVNEQVRLMEDLIRRVNQALNPLLPSSTVSEEASLTNHGLTAPEGAVTEQATSGKRRKRGNLSQATPAVDQISPETVGNSEKTESSENPGRQELPTYTNQGDGAYKLKDELEFIYKRLQKEGVEESKIQAVKAAADKFNEAFSKGDTVSQDAFDAALVDLKKSRDLIEGVLESKYGEDATTRRVNIEPRDGGEELPSRGRGRRVSRSIEQGSDIYENHIESYFEDGKKGPSPYDKYTYVFYSRRVKGTLDYTNRPVKDAKGYIRANVIVTERGLKWDIYINDAHKELTGSSVWFTLPRGQNYINNTISISKIAPNGSGSTYSVNPDTILDNLKNPRLGFSRVHLGTPERTGVIAGGSALANGIQTGSLDGLARRKGRGTNNDPYRRQKESSVEQNNSNTKFNQIVKDSDKLYYFELGRGTDKYRISFETSGNRNLSKTSYAVGIRGIENVTLDNYFLVNQWHSRTYNEAKEGAKDDIEQARQRKNESLGNNGNLSPVEQNSATGKVNTYAREAKREIDNANSFIEVDDALQKGLRNINGVNPVGKDIPKAEVKRVADAKRDAISKNSTLTNDEKTAAKEKVDAEESKANTAIDSKTTNAEVSSAKDAGIENINNVSTTVSVRPSNGGNQAGSDSRGDTASQGDRPAPSGDGSQGDANNQGQPTTPSAPAHSGDSTGQATDPSAQQRETGNAIAPESPQGLSGSSVTAPTRSRRSVTFAGGAQSSQEKQVDKSVLRNLIQDLETRLKDLDGIDQSVIDAAKIILGEGQESLRNADLTEAGLKEMTAKVKEALESLKGKQATKDEEETKETRKEQGHLPYGTMIASLLALLGLLLFLIARRKKESELKKLTKELTKVLQENDLTSVDTKVLDQAREALAQAVAFLANEKESDHTEDELIEKLKAILAQLR